MTRTTTAAFDSEASAASLSPFFAVELAFASGTARIWTGYGSINFAGEDWNGSGDVLSISGLTETSEVAANGVSIGLSGLSTDLIASALTEAYQGRSCKIYFGFLDTAGAVVDAPINVFTGRMDLMTVEDGGDTADITLTVENRLLDLERSRARRYTSEDQKIDFPDDKGLDFVADLQDKNVVWGA